jgi:hypothetical protein
LFETTLDMIAGEKVLVAYVSTDMWQQRKQKALEEAVAAEMPEIRKKIKQDLRAYWDPIIEEEVRREHNNRNDTDAESEVVRRAVGKVVLFPSLDESDAWAQALLQAERK